ncbi:flagellar biosynthesis anti-sigma factor FlgM [Syntrophotalea acetylenivorans]|uniref:Negative regulator of flagellin synthesis n=1 Tax=Syntrophotalea acetylenivorans TaxID=1842532 RepID=A0A1L3GN24_9BACT|nr:flagellar biosynthesis anti-sigma factor FlgM [Syntrophotalea acetylenivorans]APG27343.1 flagellar biosynthesis anti-sigma factor FlgM [Syntrophotalea acetylenivorans]
MTIDKVFGNSGIGPLDRTKNRVQAKKTDQAGAPSGSDQVRFSDTLQQANKAQSAGPSADVQRSEKLQALKEQISAGTYRPDTRKVAASLLQFIAESK